MIIGLAWMLRWCKHLCVLEIGNGVEEVVTTGCYRYYKERVGGSRSLFDNVRFNLYFFI